MSSHFRFLKLIHLFKKYYSYNNLTPAFKCATHILIVKIIKFIITSHTWTYNIIDNLHYLHSVLYKSVRGHKEVEHHKTINYSSFQRTNKISLSAWRNRKELQYPSYGGLLELSANISPEQRKSFENKFTPTISITVDPQILSVHRFYWCVIFCNFSINWIFSREFICMPVIMVSQKEINCDLLLQQAPLAITII